MHMFHSAGGTIDRNTFMIGSRLDQIVVAVSSFSLNSFFKKKKIFFLPSFSHFLYEFNISSASPIFLLFQGALVANFCCSLVH